MNPNEQIAQEAWSHLEQKKLTNPKNISPCVCLGRGIILAAIEKATNGLYRKEVVQKPWGREKVFTPASKIQSGEQLAQHGSDGMPPLRGPCHKQQPDVVTVLRKFVYGIEGYRETGVWPDNGQLRQWADEGLEALSGEHDAFKCEKCGSALGWTEPRICDNCRGEQPQRSEMETVLRSMHKTLTEQQQRNELRDNEGRSPATEQPKRYKIETAAGPACSICGHGWNCWLGPDDSPCQCIAAPRGEQVNIEQVRKPLVDLLLEIRELMPDSTMKDLKERIDALVKEEK